MNRDFLEAFTNVEQLQSFLDWEKGMREEIAQEIETMPFKPSLQPTIKTELVERRDAAAIARGKRD